MKIRIAVVVALALCAGVVFAGPKGETGTLATPVNAYGTAGVPVRQADDAGTVVTAPGRDEAGNAVQVATDNYRNVKVVAPTCVNVAQAVVSVGVTAVAVPASSMAGRKSLRVCNSSENVGSPKVKCLLGAVDPVMGVANAGDVLAVGECFTYATDSTTGLRCISDTAGTAVSTFECT